MAYFDKVACLDLVKASLTSADKKRTEALEIAMAGCLDDLSLRLKTKATRTTVEETISADEYEITLRGANDDLNQIFALSLGTGNYRRVLTYEDDGKFLKNRDPSAESVGRPKIYTHLTSEDGFPTITLSAPLEEAETLTVYYYPQLTSSEISKARSIACVAAGTLAWFKGIGEEPGASYYRRFEELAGLTRADDTFLSQKVYPLELSHEDRDIRSAVNNTHPRYR